jgi:type IV fimbrial biogenesis protein FimT
MNSLHTPPRPVNRDPAYPARALARPRGFTLIELLVVVSVMAVLAALAMPSMGRIVDSTRLTSVSNDFLASMYLARSEAIKRNRPVGLCKSADGLRCTGTGGWEQGWIVFHDSNNNGAADPGELIVHVAEGLPRGFRFLGNQNVAKYISFTPGGRTRMISGAFQAGTLTLCKGIEGARQIVINNVGRARVDNVPGSVCL